MGYDTVHSGYQNFRHVFNVSVECGRVSGAGNLEKILQGPNGSVECHFLSG